MPLENVAFRQSLARPIRDNFGSGAPDCAVDAAARTLLVRRRADQVAMVSFAPRICGDRAMLNPKLFDELAARFSELAATGPAKDIEKNVRALLASLFSRLDLVTRDEFDIQSELLARARDKLAALEGRIAELERKLPPAP